MQRVWESLPSKKVNACWETVLTAKNTRDSCCAQQKQQGNHTSPPAKATQNKTIKGFNAIDVTAIFRLQVKSYKFHGVLQK